jgi:toluene monooxygenase system ferredoxin subunit
MAFSRVCGGDELAAGDMAAFSIDGEEVLVLRDQGGALHALEGICPHEDFPLVHGDFDGTVVTCANHQWSFDATTGQGINPPGCRLDKYQVRVDGEDVFVDPDAEAAT